MLNEGDSIHRSLSLAWGEPVVFNHFREEPEGWRELPAAGLGQGLLAGARSGVGDRSWSGGGVWGWKGQRFGLEGLWE